MTSKTVAVSGYFNPLHKGHIELFHLAKGLGDSLIVIVNNDKQIELKGSQVFQDENERLKIISELRIIDGVFLSVNNDRTVSNSLRKLKPDIFANGGDVDSIPDKEKVACQEMNIEMIFGLGDKIQSSSELKSKLKLEG